MQQLSTDGLPVLTHHTTLHDRSAAGATLEVALVGREGDERPFPGGQLLVDEVGRHRPEILVVNLLEFDSQFGMPLIGALVRGADALNRLGGTRHTRLVATGETAARLSRTLALMKIESLFGSRIHTSLESALHGERSSD